MNERHPINVWNAHSPERRARLIREKHQKLVDLPQKEQRSYTRLESLELAHFQNLVEALDEGRDIQKVIYKDDGRFRVRLEPTPWRQSNE